MLRSLGVVLRGFEVKFSTKAHNLTEIIPDEDVLTKSLKVAIIGMPNVGKSTLINNLMDRKVCPTSRKVHTTRAKSKAVFTEGDSQIVFLDTPGLVSLHEHKKFNLEKSFLKDSKASLQEADVIGVVHDTSNVWSRDKLDLKLIRLLESNIDTPSILIFNKVDMLRSKRLLLDLTRLVTDNRVNNKPIPGVSHVPKEDKIRGWPGFQEIFMVSALTGDGLPELKNYLIRRAKPGKWLFPSETYTDRPREQIITESVKAKLLDFLPQEIPYTLKTELEFFEVNDKGVISTVVLVHCPTERIAKLIAGVSDGKLRQITESLQHDLQNTFQTYVRIKLVLDSP